MGQWSMDDGRSRMDGCHFIQSLPPTRERTMGKSGGVGGLGGGSACHCGSEIEGLQGFVVARRGGKSGGKGEG